MTQQLFYGDDDDDDRTYAVELFDVVEINLDGFVHEGVVRRIHPRKRHLTVRYEDRLDFARSTGEPRRKTVSVPLAAACLIARDG